MTAQKKSILPAKRATKKSSAASGIKVTSEPRRMQSKPTTCASVTAAVCASSPLPMVQSPAAAVTPVKCSPQPKRVTFSVRADPGSKVFVAGDFNKWDAAANPLTDPSGTGDFSTVVTMAPGSYEYKFVINGTWCVDPECTEWAQNSLGTLNSVCRV